MFTGLQETGFYLGTLIGQVNFKKKSWIYVKKNWLVPSYVFYIIKAQDFTTTFFYIDQRVYARQLTRVYWNNKHLAYLIFE